MISQSVPLPLAETFAQYAHLTDRLRKHYLSPRVFLYLVSGQFIPPIHRKNLYSLQYSMLPARRVTVGELWRLLSESGSGKTDSASMNGTAPGHPNGGGGGGGGRKSARGKVPPGEKGGYWWSR